MCLGTVWGSKSGWHAVVALVCLHCGIVVLNQNRKSSFVRKAQIHTKECSRKLLVQILAAGLEHAKVSLNLLAAVQALAF